MTSRKKMIQAIENGQSVAQAAREAGVSRVTAYRWLHRAEEQGIEALSEQSRRPLECPTQTPQEAVEELLAAKALHPSFGAKKLCAWLQNQGRALPFCVRTADRLLARNGLTTQRAAAPSPATTRFVAPRQTRCGSATSRDWDAPLLAICRFRCSMTTRASLWRSSRCLSRRQRWCLRCCGASLASLDCLIVC